MKNKLLLVAAVILVSLGLLNISKVVQNKYLSKNSVSTEQKAKDETPLEVNTSKEVNTSNEVNLKEDNKDDEDQQVSGSNTHKEEPNPIIKEETEKTKVESKTVTKQNNKVESKAELKTTINSTENITVTKDIEKEQVIKDAEPKKEPNFIIKNDISGEIILAIDIITENKTVGEITLRELDNNAINYKASGRGEAVYFTMISSLKARDFGPLSGWCYYVNGSKASVSCGAYKLKPGDVVEWKYLKDGVNN